MPKSKPRKLSDVIPPPALQGSNDKRWFLMEHQLLQTKLSLQMTLDTLNIISGNPEYEEEEALALDCMSFVRDIYITALDKIAALYSYISNSDIPERIGRKEL